MEKHHNKSVFDFIKNQRFERLDNKNLLHVSEEFLFNSEVLKMRERISELQQKVTNESEDINDMMKELEFYLSLGNNNKKLTQFFFNSKLFLSIVECLDYAKPKFLAILLVYIEKMLRGSKYIAKYLSNQSEFLRKIFIFMSKESLFETCIKITEEIFMNSHKLIPIGQFYKEIEKNYKLIVSSNLHTFCRILAIMIFDHKKMEFKQIFKYRENLKIKPFPKVTTENQSMCYHLPNFLYCLIGVLKTKLNYTMNTAKQIPYIYSLLSNNELSASDSLETDTSVDQGNLVNDCSKKLKKITISSNMINNFNTEKETLRMFQSLWLCDLTLLINANIFQNFVPDWSYFERNKKSETKIRDNIFNNYKKLSKVFKRVKNIEKIKDSNKQYINVLKYSTCQIEMLFVLSTLIGCKRKNEIQDKLSHQEIIELLNKYIDFIEWGNLFNESNRPFFDVNEVNYSDDSAYHGRGCKCDSDTALKIQFLRFVYTYCSRDNNNVNNKLHLFSDLDLQNAMSPSYLTLFYFYFFKNYAKYKGNNNIKFNKSFYKFLSLVKNNFYQYFVKTIDQGNKNTNEIVSDFSKIENKNNQDEYDQNIQKIILDQLSLENLEKFVYLYNNNNDNIGLLSKLIVKYIQECQYSSSKFWLASCIEVMIRGNNTFFQFYIGAYTGLIPYLLYDILYSKNEQAQIFQLSFDILGELIKFNKANFLILNYYFVDNNEFKTFTKKIINNSSLVDSNVFLRSIIISINYFNHEDEKLQLKKEQYFTSNCKFCSFINENLPSIFNNLIIVVKPDDINQTNISCINTALLILILYYMNGSLATFLNNIRTKFEDSKTNLENFKCLIAIWKDFYNYRPKDSSSLQHSTMINFNIWQTVTTILIEKDEKNPESLYYVY